MHLGPVAGLADCSVAAEIPAPCFPARARARARARRGGVWNERDGRDGVASRALPIHPFYPGKVGGIRNVP
jgi:hypothetical protein